MMGDWAHTPPDALTHSNSHRSSHIPYTPIRVLLVRARQAYQTISIFREATDR
jgi:hypothetical protein